MMKKNVRDVISVVFGNFLLAVSVVYFVLPYDILSGGCAGIAVITEKIFHWAPTTTIDALVIFFFIAGSLVLGKEFALKTILSSVVYPIFIELLSRFPLQIDIDPLIAVVFGGAIAGIGIGITFRHGASTGGTDIPPLIIHKYTGWDVGTLVFIFDGLTAIAGLLAYGLEDVLYGIIYIYVSSYAIQRFSTPNTSNAISLYIITDKYDEVLNYVHNTLERGTTILEATGGYTSIKRNVILTVVSKAQYNLLSAYLDNVDPTAFVIVSDAKEIKGEGFTYEYRV